MRRRRGEPVRHCQLAVQIDALLLCASVLCWAQPRGVFTPPGGMTAGRNQAGVHPLVQAPLWQVPVGVHPTAGQLAEPWL